LIWNPNLTNFKQIKKNWRYIYFKSNCPAGLQPYLQSCNIRHIFLAIINSFCVPTIFLWWKDNAQ
jgi:hypothetical protein